MNLSNTAADLDAEQAYYANLQSRPQQLSGTTQYAHDPQDPRLNRTRLPPMRNQAVQQYHESENAVGHNVPPQQPYTSPEDTPPVQAPLPSLREILSPSWPRNQNIDIDAAVDRYQRSALPQFGTAPQRVNAGQIYSALQPSPWQRYRTMPRQASARHGYNVTQPFPPQQYPGMPQSVVGGQSHSFSQALAGQQSSSVRTVTPVAERFEAPQIPQRLVNLRRTEINGQSPSEASTSVASPGHADSAAVDGDPIPQVFLPKERERLDQARGTRDGAEFTKIQQLGERGPTFDDWFVYSSAQGLTYLKCVRRPTCTVSRDVPEHPHHQIISVNCALRLVSRPNGAYWGRYACYFGKDSQHNLLGKLSLSDNDIVPSRYAGLCFAVCAALQQVKSLTSTSQGAFISDVIVHVEDFVLIRNLTDREWSRDRWVPRGQLDDDSQSVENACNQLAEMRIRPYFRTRSSRESEGPWEAMNLTREA